MADSLKTQQFKSWLRRPTLFIANAWYLMAGAGITLLPIVVMLIARLLAMIAPETAQFDWSSMASALYEVAILAFPVVWYAVRHEGVSQAMRLNAPSPMLMIMALVAAYFAVPLCNALSMWWMLLIEALGGRLYDSGVAIPQTSQQLTTAILISGMLPGICEELFFRGGIMGAWERRGTHKALWISSILFALLHGSIFGLPVQLIMGLTLGYLVILSDSLYVGMTFHTAYNSILLIVGYLGGSSQDAAIEMYQDLAAYVNLNGGMGILAAQTAIYGAEFVGCLLLMRFFQRAKGVEFEKIKTGDESKMTWQELLVLMAGLITVGIAYVVEMLRVCRAIW